MKWSLNTNDVIERITESGFFNWIEVVETNSLKEVLPPGNQIFDSASKQMLNT